MEKDNILSQKENRRITDKVLEYQKMPPGPERDETERALTERTELLLYLIPLDRGFLTRDDAAGFYLEQKKNAPVIMNTYKVSKLFYHDYIAQVLRKRCINYIMRVRRRNSDWAKMNYLAGRGDIEKNFTVNDNAVPYITDYGGTINIYGEDMPKGYALEVPQYSAEAMETAEAHAMPPEKPIKEMTLSEIIEHMREARSGEDLTRCGQCEEEIRRMLEKRRNRESFIDMLLYIPDDDAEMLRGHISRVLGVKSEIIDRFFLMRSEVSGVNEERKQRDRELANRHYAMMLRIDQASLLTNDEAEKEHLLKSSMRLRAAYEKKLKAVRIQTRGLSQRQIAEIMGISRSLVSLNLTRMRAMLKETLGEQVLHTEKREDRITSS